MAKTLKQIMDQLPIGSEREKINYLRRELSMAIALPDGRPDIEPYEPHNSRQIRSDALEEAAKVCEKDRCSVDPMCECHDENAIAIRALKKEG